MLFPIECREDFLYDRIQVILLREKLICPCFIVTVDFKSRTLDIKSR